MSLKMSQMRRVCSILSVALLFFQSTFSQYHFGALDDYLQKNQKALGGEFAVLIYKDGKVVYQKAIGEFNAKTQVPIGAAGNWLTAALVMTFVDQGKLSLDDPVSQYLPEF